MPVPSILIKKFTTSKFDTMNKIATSNEPTCIVKGRLSVVTSGLWKITSNEEKTSLTKLNLRVIVEASFELSLHRADQNTSGALLEFPMRTAMHGKFRFLSAICLR